MQKEEEQAVPEKQEGQVEEHDKSVFPDSLKEEEAHSVCSDTVPIPLTGAREGQVLDSCPIDFAEFNPDDYPDGCHAIYNTEVETAEGTRKECEHAAKNMVEVF